MSKKPSYHLAGILLGACSCDWGCPCNFEAAPSQGFCEGGYIWHLKRGRFDKTPLDGLNIGWLGHSPGPLHLGNVTSVLFLDERATAAQRKALERICDQKSEIAPFSIFLSLTSKLLGVHYVPFELELKGIKSHARIPGRYEVQLAPMTNPVTGEEEPATLLKPKGFTSHRQQLCSASVLKISHQELSFSHPGKYGEYSTFEYKSK